MKKFLDALRVIRSIRRHPAKASKIKSDYFCQIGIAEAFLGATPAFFIYITMAFEGLSPFGNDHNLHVLLVGEWNWNLKDFEKLLFFVISGTSSLFTSAHGAAR